MGLKSNQKMVDYSHVYVIIVPVGKMYKAAVIVACRAHRWRILIIAFHLVPCMVPSRREKTSRGGGGDEGFRSVPV